MDSILLKQKFRKFYIYRNEINYYIVCANKDKTRTKIIMVSRLNASLDVTVQPSVFTLEDAFRFVAKALTPPPADPNDPPRKISSVLLAFFVAKSYGIIGFPKFLDGPYIYFITKRVKVGSIFGGDIYRIEEAKLEMVLNQDLSCLYKISHVKTSEIKYLEYFNSLDYKDFYFSYELDLTNKCQRYLDQSSMKQESRYIWNSAMLETYFDLVPNDEFVLPVICGYVEIQPFKIGCKSIKVGVISRRSRYHAGVRFLRRGINLEGEVANDVETEFIVWEDFPFQNVYKHFFSFVMIRGSIPFFWGHEKTTINPKPPIIIDQTTDPEQKVTERHFKRLFESYGNEVCVLNLVKSSQKSSESVLGRLFKRFADQFSNRLKTTSKGPKLRFKWIDFHSIYNQSETEVIAEMQDYARSVFRICGMFEYSMFHKQTLNQRGVIRVNCIDCLDRTNNAMACISSVVLAECLIRMEVTDSELVDVKNIVVRNELLSLLFEMFGV